MKKFYIVALTIIIPVTVIFGILYATKNTTNPLEYLYLEIFSSFSLGLVIILFGIIFEDLWQREKSKKRLKSELNLINENLKNVFSRIESPWNFDNTTPSFYFDSSHINKIHDLLYDNNQRWYKFILEYKELLRKEFKKSIVLTNLYKFNSIFNFGQILGEKIDQSVKQLLLNPSLAADKRQGNIIEIQTWNEYYDQNFLFYRSCFIEIDQNSVFFESIRYINTSINMQRIEGAYSEANLLLDSRSSSYTELKKDILKLRETRKQLLKLSEKMYNVLVK